MKRVCKELRQEWFYDMGIFRAWRTREGTWMATRLKNANVPNSWIALDNKPYKTPVAALAKYVPNLTREMPY